MTDSEEHTPDVPIRASDAERDRIVARLQHHCAVGRLTLAELEERVALAFRARTREQLDALVRDLPEEARELRQSGGVDSRLLVVLLCCSPPAALVYWLISRRPARGGRARPSGDPGA